MKTVDRSVTAFFWQGVKVSLGRPGQAWRFARTIRWQAAAAKKRRSWQQRGVRVPPIVIFSITHMCNLDCVGCYAKTFMGDGATDCPGAPGEDAGEDQGEEGETRGLELSDIKLRGIVEEATELGVSFFVIAGGEPFMRREIMDIAERYPHVVFLVFTNGLLLDEAMVERIDSLRNVVPLISLEGSAEQTDQRRGAGTYEQLVSVMARLRERDLFFGCSLTLTSRNFSTIFSEAYINGLIEAGCRMFLLADYTPVEEGTEDWVLDAEQRAQVLERVRQLRGRHRALFVAVPWDEQEAGGCLAAGRGFVHVNASGGVEPCPFAPFSASDLNEVSLLDALKSPFLTRLREMPEIFEYEGAGCELWNHRAQVEEALVKSMHPE